MIKSLITQHKNFPYHCKCCHYTGSGVRPRNHRHLQVFLLKCLVRHLACSSSDQRHVSESRLPGLLLPLGDWDSANESNMADRANAEDHQTFSLPINEQMPLSSIIPAVQEARKYRPPFVPSVGLPNVIRTPQELMVERVMENCAFKSVLAGVVGTDKTSFCFIYFQN